MINTWNRHLIRPSRNARVPSGRPNILYFMPELYDATDFLCDVPHVQIEACKDECRFREPIPCDEDVHELCCAIMVENGHEFPSGPQSAVDLYKELRQSITALLN